MVVITNVLAAIVFMVVTNYSKEMMSTGTRPLPCPDSVQGYSCAVYHCETVYSSTDYFEIEKVSQEERLTYIKTDGTKGFSVIGSKDLSWRKRGVRQKVVIQKSMETNDWSDLAIGSSMVNFGAGANWICISTNNSIGLGSNIVLFGESKTVK